MINEEFDDDVSGDDLDRMMAEGNPVEVITVKPGDSMRVLAGREIWFNTPKPGQFSAWNRYRESLVAKFYKLRNRVKGQATAEDLIELRDVSEKLDLITIELFESLVVNPDDIDFVAMQMIAGKVSVVDLNRVLFGGDEEPEDDEAPKPKKKATPKKTANVSRIKKR